MQQHFAALRFRDPKFNNNNNNVKQVFVWWHPNNLNNKHITMQGGITILFINGGRSPRLSVHVVGLLGIF